MLAHDIEAFKTQWDSWTGGKPDLIAAEVLFEDLQKLHDELKRWQAIKNLVSRETLHDIWQRHILDSLQLIRFLPATSVRIVDFGSGAGFPALILAIALKADDKAHIHLVESNQRKASYLNAMIRKFSLNATVWNKRSEDLSASELGDIDIITGRGFRPLKDFFELTSQFWHPNVQSLLHKGQNYMSEIEIARSDWRFDLIKQQSAIDTHSVILQISNLEKAHG